MHARMHAYTRTCVHACMHARTHRCDWLDDSTLVAFLSLSTGATAGMTVAIRSNVLCRGSHKCSASISYLHALSARMNPAYCVCVLAQVLWPRGYEGSCADSDSKCAPAQALTVGSLFPCDTRSTMERELCIEPTAVIQAPTELGSCPGSQLQLDGSRSTGGGVRPLVYSWAAPPRSCDNYYEVAAALTSAGSMPSVVLPASALNGGSSFTITLTVITFLGRVSAPFHLTITRAPLPVPSLVVLAAPLLTFPASSGVTLEAQASVHGCMCACVHEAQASVHVCMGMGAWVHG